MDVGHGADGEGADERVAVVAVREEAWDGVGHLVGLGASVVDEVEVDHFFDLENLDVDALDDVGEERRHVVAMVALAMIFFCFSARSSCAPSPCPLVGIELGAELVDLAPLENIWHPCLSLPGGQCGVVEAGVRWDRSMTGWTVWYRRDQCAERCSCCDSRRDRGP